MEADFETLRRFVNLVAPHVGTPVTIGARDAIGRIKTEMDRLRSQAAKAKKALGPDRRQRRGGCC